MPELPDTLAQLTERLRRFADARDWQRVHTPKNLTAAIAGEAGELVAILQWSPADASPTSQEREALGDEMADLLIYLTRLADVCGIDLVEAANAKVDRNERRFPPRS